MSGTSSDPIVIPDDDYSRLSTPAIELPCQGLVMVLPVTRQLRWNSALTEGAPVTNNHQPLSYVEAGAGEPCYQLHIYVALTGDEARCFIFLLGLVSLMAVFLQGHY